MCHFIVWPFGINMILVTTMWDTSILMIVSVWFVQFILGITMSTFLAHYCALLKYLYGKLCMRFLL
ncbi:MAG: hypothetical protein IGNPGNKH_00890 [Sodalis sp. Ffu]|nr:MAG: hypothetical protein IGNPGNKH_00890 [Sodalis sp. Ffu]